MTRFKAISFDAAGTLLHAHPSVGHVYAEVAGRHGAVVDPHTMDTAFRKAFAARRGLPPPPAPGPRPSLRNEGFDWWKQLVFEVMADLQLRVSAPDTFFRELYWRFAEVDVWRLYPDALPALLIARGLGLKIALLSNWDVRLRRLIEGMGIAPLFDTMVISTEVGLEKPDPEIFRLACRRLDAQPQETLHIGDSAREDVEGATAAGLEVARIDREGKEGQGPCVLTDLRQIEPLITR